MNTSLPARPNLEHLRTQAKQLLARLRADDADAAQTFIDYLPAAKNMTPVQVRRAQFRLADAQSAIAVDYLNIGRGSKGVTLGVIELQGEVVRFCIAPAGGARPTDFTSERGSGWTFSEWKRKT